jgi:hypothetical protein
MHLGLELDLKLLSRISLMNDVEVNVEKLLEKSRRGKHNHSAHRIVDKYIMMLQ